jgi:hypothetical protein
MSNSLVAQKHSDSAYALTDACRMEWLKLRTLRSNFGGLGLAILAAIGVSIAVGAHTQGTGDLTNNFLSGIAIGLLITGVLGTLVMSSEYTTGLVRSTFAAVPNRRMVLAAKASVFGAAALVAGELASFISFFAGRAAASGRGIVGPGIGDPSVIRAILLGGVGYALIGILGLGIGALVRHTPAAIGVLVGGVYVAAQALGGALPAIRPYLPIAIVADSLTTVHKPGYALPAALGLLVLAGYAALALVAGGWRLTHRDA